MFTLEKSRSTILRQRLIGTYTYVCWLEKIIKLASQRLIKFELVIRLKFIAGV